MSEADLPRIDALDLRPGAGETPDLEFVWDWPTPPAVSAADENRSEPPPSRVSAARS